MCRDHRHFACGRIQVLKIEYQITYLPFFRRNSLIFSYFITLIYFKIRIDGEYGDYFEGDIILLPKPDFAPRNGLRGADFRWPNNTLYYKMSTNHTQEQQNIILKAMDILQSVSCVKFKPQTNQTGYVQFVVSIKFTNSSRKVFQDKCN